MPGLDINWFREDKGHNPELIRQSLKKRYKDPNLVDQIIEKDKHWRKMRFELDMLKKEWNEVGQKIKAKKKADKADACEEELAIKNQNELKQKEVAAVEKETLETIDALVNSCGNIVHETVPCFQDEADNKVERTWGDDIPRVKITGKLGGLHHHEVLEAIGGYDPKRGQRIAGHRGYFLKGCGVLLNNALMNYGLKFLAEKKYDLVQPPYLMKKEIMYQTCQISDFEENLYKVEGKGAEVEDKEYFLIATSEQPISAMHCGEWLEESCLPINYAGTSTCFRKEAGAHGKDNWGIFRIHQFEKIEQFLITAPDDSWRAHEQMIAVSEEFMQSLELPYQVVNIVSGALNDAAAKKYDLEAWFPGYDAYRELMSVSNCTEWQSRNLEVRCGIKKAETKEKKYVHMLNGTLCATERTLCCILENFQTPEGLRVPKVLQPYVGKDFIPYTQQFLKEFAAKQQKEQKQDLKKQGPKAQEHKPNEEKKVEETAEKEPTST